MLICIDSDQSIIIATAVVWVKKTLHKEVDRSTSCSDIQTYDVESDTQTNECRGTTDGFVAATRQPMKSRPRRKVT